MDCEPKSFPSNFLLSALLLLTEAVVICDYGMTFNFSAFCNADDLFVPGVVIEQQSVPSEVFGTLAGKRKAVDDDED